MPMPSVAELLELAFFSCNPVVADFFLVLKISAMLVVGLWEAETLTLWVVLEDFSAFLTFLHTEFGEGLGLFLVIFSS